MIIFWSSLTSANWTLKWVLVKLKRLLYLMLGYKKFQLSQFLQLALVAHVAALVPAIFRPRDKVVLYFFGFKFLKTRFGNFSWLQNPCLPGLSHAWLTRWQLRFPQEEFFSVMFQRNLLLRISDVQALCFFQFWQQQHNTTTTDILSVFYYTFMVASLKSQKVKNEKKFNRHFVSP